MKLNWTALKILLAFVVIVGVVFWAVDSVRTRSYSGTDLSFDTGGGTITVNNLSDEPAAAQFVSSGTRIFRVSSTVEGVSGSSTRVGTGGTRIHQFEFVLPPGTSELTVSGGSDVRFVADTATELEATVNPMTSDSRRNTLIATAVVVFGTLFYASNTTDHQWFKSLRHKVLPSDADTAEQDTAPTPVASGSDQGRAARPFGDNRADVGD